MGLFRSLVTVGGMTLLSRILGFVRDYVIARTFGAGSGTDAFFVAFKLPNLLRRLFAEGAFSQAFVPILGEYRNRRGQLETRQLIDRVATALALVLIVVTVLGIICAPFLVYVAAPGFAAIPGKFQLTVELTRLTFPYIFFVSLVAFAGGILNSWGHFAIPAFTPALLNLTLIGVVLIPASLLTLSDPILALGWAVLIGGACQLFLQGPALAKIHMLPRFDFAPRDEGVRRVLTQMGPALLGVSVAQLSLLINTVFASFLKSGSVSWLYYADRLMEFPTGMLGVALGTVLLPSLTKLHAENNVDEYSRLLDWGLRLTFLLAVPAAIALALLATPLISTLFLYGAFTADDLLRTKEALNAYSVGLTGLIVVKVLAPGYYARQNIRTPVRIAIMALGVTQALNLILIVPLQHAGLALSIGLAACVNAWMLYRGLTRDQIYRPEPGWRKFFFKLGLAVSGMAAMLVLVVGTDERWIALTAIGRALNLAWIVVAGAATYFAVLALLGFRLRDFRRRTNM